MRHLVLTFLLLSLSHISFADSVIDLRGDKAQQKLAELRADISAQPDNAVARKEAGIILHQLSRAAPNKDDVYEAEKYLKAASKLDKSDNETLAWLGSITTMKAQFETDPGKQTFFVKSGSLKMDKAIKREPDNSVVRLTRAYNSLEIPPFLKRTRFAVVDFKHYLNLCEQTNVCTDAYILAAQQGLEKAQQIVELSGS